MATKHCKVYHGDNWVYPPGYRVTECDIEFTLEELLDTAIEIIADEGMIPSNIYLSDQNDEEIEIEFLYKNQKGKFVCDYLTTAEIENLEENIIPNYDYEAIVKYLNSIMNDMYSKKELREYITL